MNEAFQTLRHRWRFAPLLAASLLFAVAQPLMSRLVDEQNSFDVLSSLLILAVIDTHRRHKTNALFSRQHQLANSPFGRARTHDDLVIFQEEPVVVTLLECPEREVERAERQPHIVAFQHTYLSILRRCSVEGVEELPRFLKAVKVTWQIPSERHVMDHEQIHWHSIVQA